MIALGVAAVAILVGVVPAAVAQTEQSRHGGGSAVAANDAQPPHHRRSHGDHRSTPTAALPAFSSSALENGGAPAESTPPTQPDESTQPDDGPASTSAPTSGTSAPAACDTSGTDADSWVQPDGSVAFTPSTRGITFAATTLPWVLQQLLHTTTLSPQDVAGVQLALSVTGPDTTAAYSLPSGEQAKINSLDAGDYSVRWRASAITLTQAFGGVTIDPHLLRGVGRLSWRGVVHVTDNTTCVPPTAAAPRIETAPALTMTAIAPDTVQGPIHPSTSAPSSPPASSTQPPSTQPASSQPPSTQPSTHPYPPPHSSPVISTSGAPGSSSGDTGAASGSGGFGSGGSGGLTPAEGGTAANGSGAGANGPGGGSAGGTGSSSGRRGVSGAPGASSSSSAAAAGQSPSGGNGSNGGKRQVEMASNRAPAPAVPLILGLIGGGALVLVVAVVMRLVFLRRNIT